MYFQMFPDNAVKREMSILAVQCINPGCPWVGKFRHYEVGSLGMRGSRKFCQRGSKFDNIFLLFLFFLVDEGIEDPNTAINGPSSARQRNAI